MAEAAQTWLGRSLPRVEDLGLLTGRGRFIDDTALPAGALHLAILRSPHAHAKIESLDVAAARALPGVAAVLTGQEVTALCGTLMSGVRLPAPFWPIAVDRVRYMGEPVALAVAESRYLAEDALDLIEVRYRPLPVVVDPVAALADDAPVLYPELGGNLAHERSFSYGDPDRAFAEAAHRIAIDVSYPRNVCTPIETCGVVADYDPGEDAYDILATFQGPFSIHAVLARALKVPANRLRLRTPRDAGGSFGVKQAVTPYIVLAGVAARASGRPVAWTEDRLEHLAGSVTATNRVTHLAAAVTADGRILALDWDQIEDCGTQLRAPEPATLYRMHGNMTGAYDIRDLRIRNRVVLTNKLPTGINRGFGGPQVYYALGRLSQRIARTLGLDPLEVIRRNLVPGAAMPYRTASGALLDSGDYAAAVDRAVDQGGLDALKQRQRQARAEGRLYGIGLMAVVEPSVSNMGYITTVLTPEERRRAGPKNGAQATATVGVDPLGGVSVHVASVPQGQGHRTVLAQVVADRLGLEPGDVRVVAELDTARDAWSIASGNYSSRFAAVVAGTANIAAGRLADQLARIAAAQLNVRTEDVVFADSKAMAADNPENAVPFGRLAATGHWAPGTLPDVEAPGLRQTVFWTPPELTAPTEADEINSSLCHGFIFDFCGIEVDRDTGQLSIDKYVTMHDCGRVLHPAMVDGQITGSFAQALGAAVYEHHQWGDDGSHLTGTLAEYLLPTVMEVPVPTILHYESPSPFTPLGAKGVGEGNCMSTPVCLANAVTDALDLEDIDLPLAPAKLAALIHEPERAPPEKTLPAGRALFGDGEARVAAPRQEVWDMLLDPATLARVIPGAHGVERVAEHRFRAEATVGVGPVRGRYAVEVELADLVPPASLTLSGRGQGPLGFGHGRAAVTLAEDGDGTVVGYRYEAAAGGKAAAIGGRLLDGAARALIAQFFAALAREAGGEPEPTSWWAKLLAWFK